ncbi:hypothetical protein [Salinibacterium sp. ZJ450]|uniref:hypothetical protein n=1 Tax=Salinibacterium sp. ZJ450 TaxID=2708338 RepID=UPI00141D9897|nr:hypothetical protein [Salinibacterium sp. ZJ450]
MYWVRVALAIGLAAGFLITVGGLIGAYRSARQQLQRAGGLPGATERLQQEEDEELARVAAGPSYPAEVQAIYARYKQRHIRETGLPRPAGFGEAHTAGHEATLVFGALLDSSQKNLIVAGTGLLISTTASIGSLFLLS